MSVDEFLEDRGDRRIRWAATLVGVGLLVQALSLVWSHPTAFVLFLVVGAVLVLAGVVTYLADRALSAG
jgi:hydrogenase/urease accessory protein HupE